MLTPLDPGPRQRAYSDRVQVRLPLRPDDIERVCLDVVGRTVCLDVVGAGLACCGLEVSAARTLPLPAQVVQTASHQGADVHVLVVAGTVTQALAPELRRRWEAMPQPCRVVAFGACSCSGGPYWDSYAVAPGADQVVPVDVFVPGCPPHPEALWAALRDVVVGMP